MDDEEKREWLRLPGNSVEQEIPSQASPFVMLRREMTAGFDERQKQLFNEALIAILTVDMPAEKLRDVLNKAYDTTIQVFGWQMLADTHLSNADLGSERHRPIEKQLGPPATERPSPPEKARPVLLSCINCHGYNLNLSAKVVRCNDCGTIQPALETNSPERFSRERGYAKMLGIEGTPIKQIINVTLSGSTLALVFHDGTVQQQTITGAVVSAISYLLRVLDTMTWARETLENRLRELSERRNENEGQ